MVRAVGTALGNNPVPLPNACTRRSATTPSTAWSSWWTWRAGPWRS
ncbi:hypothetical protein AB0K48_54965 [Nonomuraea sp. NPDC055795]